MTAEVYSHKCNAFNPIFQYQTEQFVTKLRCKRQLLLNGDFCNFLSPPILQCHQHIPSHSFASQSIVKLENIKFAQFMVHSFHHCQQHEHPTNETLHFTSLKSRNAKHKQIQNQMVFERTISCLSLIRSHRRRHRTHSIQNVHHTNRALTLCLSLSFTRTFRKM